MSSRAVVVGAGLSGLAAAYRLQQAGLEVTVLERADRAGGLAQTEYRGGYLIDTGPDLINASFVRLRAISAFRKSLSLSRI